MLEKTEGSRVTEPIVRLGEIVPDFTLPSSEGRDISLSEFRGKYVVLYFYPADLTPGCTQEACDFRDRRAEYERLNAQVLGVSPDPVHSHVKFKAKHELPFPLLSDPDCKVLEMFGVWQLRKRYGREYMGVVRSTFLIDPEGRLVREWRNVRVASHVDEVLAELRKTVAGASR